MYVEGQVNSATPKVITQNHLEKSYCQSNLGQTAEHKLHSGFEFYPDFAILSKIKRTDEIDSTSGTETCVIGCFGFVY